jgi:hypothetical protein
MKGLGFRMNEYYMNLLYELRISLKLIEFF